MFTFFILLSLISIIFIIISAQKNKNPAPIATPPSEASQWGQITPGQSTEADVTKILGKAKSINGTTQSYNSANSTRDNQVVYRNGIVDFSKETISYTEGKTTDEITAKYGVAQNMLYGQDSVNGFYLFVYPSDGIAYLGNPVTKSLLEIWHFTPTDIDTFITKWGEGYSKTPPKGTF